MRPSCGRDRSAPAEAWCWHDGPVSDPRAAGLAAFAGLIADPTRAAFCLALLDGRAWTAGELARHAGVAASTATEHLNRMLAGGVLVERRQGRHRYVELAGPHVAHLLEDLEAGAGAHAPAVAPRTLRAATVANALARGRTCYDHLAGRLGVSISDALATRGLLDRDGGLALTDAGRDWLATELRIGPADLRSGRRPLTRACLDWTERRPHLAGLAGARICERMLERRWVARIGSGRAVRVTPSGVTALRDLLGLDLG
jgi:DNA-binding transcriptional ArsR family regulator